MGTTPRVHVSGHASGADTSGGGSVTQERVDPPSGRAQVVQAVVDLALAGGYTAVSWEAVAARSGLGLREVQQHASTIDDLLLLTLEDCLLRWISASPTWTRVDPAPGLSDEISRRLLTGIDAAADCPEFWVLGILLCLTAGHGARRARARYAGVRASARAAMAEWWSRRTPGCSCITRPTSRDMPAIACSMWEANAPASCGVTSPDQARS